jgi:ATP-binding cassette, subfamily B, bacterial HlyB/CyaB
LQEKNNHANKIPANLSWFTKSTLKYTPALIELMVISIILRLLGLIEPFVFQAIIDRVLPFQRESTLVLIVVILICSMIFSQLLGANNYFIGVLFSEKMLC